MSGQSDSKFIGQLLLELVYSCWYHGMCEVKDGETVPGQILSHGHGHFRQDDMCATSFPSDISAGLCLLDCEVDMMTRVCDLFPF